MKKNVFGKILSLTLSAAVAIGFVGWKAPVIAKADPSSATITIFHTNDMHGHLISTTNYSKILNSVGADYVSAMKKSVSGSLLIDAGDATQGLPFATVSKGADVVRIMNAAGYDGATLGNHEFDYGSPQALSNAKLANFPVVSANTMLNGKPFLAGVNGNNGNDFIKTVNGVKVGFFGITTQETVYKSNPATLDGVTFSDPISTSKTEVKELKAEGAKVIIGIMHIGNEISSNPKSDDIAKAVDGINVIIDGHSHTIENNVVNGTLIVQTGCTGANVGRVDITIDGNNKITSKETLYSAADIQKQFTPDAAVTAVADKINQTQQKLFQSVVGNTGSSLWGGVVSQLQVARLTETNMGDLVSDACVYEAAKQLAGTKYAKLPIVGQEDGGSIRDSISAGNITQGQVETVLPYDDNLVMKLLTPSDIYAMLENGVSTMAIDSKTGNLAGASGRFSQVAGMRFEYDPSKPVGSRVTKVVLLNKNGTDKKVISRSDKATQIVLAASNYEASDGGDGYTMLTPLKEIGEGCSMAYLTEQYITDQTKAGKGTFSYKTNCGRIKALIKSPATYNAKVSLTDGANPIADTDIYYSVDYGTFSKGKTDSAGILNLSALRTGSHTLTLMTADKAGDGYVDKTIGLGTDSTDTVTLSPDTADQKAAYPVIGEIMNIPATVTLSDKAVILAVSKDYNALTGRQKALVYNKSVLINAVAKLASLEKKPSASTVKPHVIGKGIVKTSTHASSTAAIQENPDTGSNLPMEPVAGVSISAFAIAVMLLIKSKQKEHTT